MGGSGSIIYAGLGGAYNGSTTGGTGANRSTPLDNGLSGTGGATSITQGYFMAGGGGGGGGARGRGGKDIVLIANNVSGTGTIDCSGRVGFNGGAGGDGSGSANNYAGAGGGGGGGGKGGSILIVYSGDVSGLTLTNTAGNGGTGGAGGSGSFGVQAFTNGAAGSAGTAGSKITTSISSLA